MRVDELEITGNGIGVIGTVSSFVTTGIMGNGTDGTLTLIIDTVSIQKKWPR